ncbi:MAG: alpha/beta hydrolase, partial [Gammaproteobacteria bacterium]|nr:alpha/beta hydrolase [Gammaproteobacteria bacterium]
MKKLHIQGVEETNTNPVIRLEGVDSAVRVKAKYEISIASARDAGTEETLSDIRDDDVMLLEFEDGIFIWTRVDQFEQDFPESKSRGGDANKLEIPRQLQLGDHNRGVSEWLLKSLKIFDIDPVSKTATGIGKMVEKGLDRPPGLYRCTTNPNPEKEAKHVLKLEKPEEKLDGSIPMLLFIHGTASSSSGSFGDLWSTSPNQHLIRLQHYFGKQIYAFEHRTLTESPIKNAIDLVKDLHALADNSDSPKSLQIHMASHSRGGLVAELLARVDVGKDEEPISDREIKQYAMAGTDYKKQVAQLKELCELLDARIERGESKGERKFSIHRFVRTACPARGTTLASGRLDRWLSVILNVIGTIPLLKASSVYGAMSSFTLAVVKQRTEPQDLPGLEAQMPTSPLVRMLNLSSSVVNADLSVISGDVEADTLWGKLKYLIPDLYYRQDHDLVVNTRSMTGGTRRKENHARKFFDQGPGVNHFQYFSNDKTAKMLVDGLLRTEKDDAGFTPISEKPGLLRSRAARIKGNKPIVFVLPGIMGSHLQVNENRIWLDIRDIATGGMRRLKIGSDGVSAESLVSSTYADLVDFLEQQEHDVIPYPYDWRLPISTEAGRFARDLETKLQLAEEHNQPLHIIAHS